MLYHYFFKVLFKIIQCYEFSANISTLLAETTREQMNYSSKAVLPNSYIIYLHVSAFSNYDTFTFSQICKINNKDCSVCCAAAFFLLDRSVAALSVFAQIRLQPLLGCNPAFQSCNTKDLIELCWLYPWTCQSNDIFIRYTLWHCQSMEEEQSRNPNTLPSSDFSTHL